MDHLTVETAVRDRVAVVALEGELDLAGASVVEQALARLETDALDALVLDLRGLKFMDSSGLRVIAVAMQRAQGAGHRFALVPGAAQVMRVFDITRMRERLQFVQDPREVTAGT